MVFFHKRYLPCVPHIPRAVAEMSKRGFGFIVTPLIHPHFPARHECDGNGNCEDDDSDFVDDDSEKPTKGAKDSPNYGTVSPVATAMIMYPSPHFSPFSSIDATKDDGHHSPASVDGDQRLLLNSTGGFTNSFRDLFGSDWAILVVSEMGLSKQLSPLCGLSLYEHFLYPLLFHPIL